MSAGSSKTYYHHRQNYYENYTKGRFTSYLGRALAVLRAGYEAGEAKLTVSAEGLGQAGLVLPVKI